LDGLPDFLNVDDEMIRMSGSRIRAGFGEEKIVSWDFADVVWSSNGCVDSRITVIFFGGFKENNAGGVCIGEASRGLRRGEVPMSNLHVPRIRLVAQIAVV